jgi:hypothetical protein
VFAIIGTEGCEKENPSLKKGWGIDMKRIMKIESGKSQKLLATTQVTSTYSTFTPFYAVTLFWTVFGPAAQYNSSSEEP